MIYQKNKSVEGLVFKLCKKQIIYFISDLPASLEKTFEQGFVQYNEYKRCGCIHKKRFV